MEIEVKATPTYFFRMSSDEVYMLEQILSYHPDVSLRKYIHESWMLSARRRLLFSKESSEVYVSLTASDMDRLVVLMDTGHSSVRQDVYDSFKSSINRAKTLASSNIDSLKWIVE